MKNICRKLLFLLFSSSRVGLFVKSRIAGTFHWWSKTTVAQSFLMPFSSNSKVAHNVLHKFNWKRFFKVLRTFLIFLQFRATGQLRTVFGTSFSFLTIRAAWKKNDSSAVWFGANFKQPHSCAGCWAQVFCKTANQSSLDIIYPTYQFRYIYSCALLLAHVIGQTVRMFCQVVVFFKFFTNDANSSNSLLRTLFYTTTASLKMSLRFWPNKPI